MILNKLSPFYFIIAFSVGLFFVYITHPAPEIVLKFPSPTNVDTVTYKDKNGQCYKYKADKVTCDDKKAHVKPQPIIEDYIDVQKNNLIL
jgi:hypothetical protein